MQNTTNTKIGVTENVSNNSGDSSDNFQTEISELSDVGEIKNSTIFQPWLENIKVFNKIAIFKIHRLRNDETVIT